MITLSKTLFAAALLTLPALSALAMPGGDHMMGHKMSAKSMKKLTACKAMDHTMAMKDKRCAKLMNAEAMPMHDGMEPADAGEEHKM
jgi:hypothetical protein